MKKLIILSILFSFLSITFNSIIVEAVGATPTARSTVITSKVNVSTPKSSLIKTSMPKANISSKSNIAKSSLNSKNLKYNSNSNFTPSNNSAFFNPTSGAFFATLFVLNSKDEEQELTFYGKDENGKPIYKDNDGNLYDPEEIDKDKITKTQTLEEKEESDKTDKFLENSLIVFFFLGLLAILIFVLVTI